MRSTVPWGGASNGSKNTQILMPLLSTTLSDARQMRRARRLTPVVVLFVRFVPAAPVPPGEAAEQQTQQQQQGHHRPDHDRDRPVVRPLVCRERAQTFHTGSSQRITQRGTTGFSHHKNTFLCQLLRKRSKKTGFSHCTKMVPVKSHSDLSSFDQERSCVIEHESFL